MSLTLISPAFSQGERIPDKHARDGENLLPPVKWSGVPEGTRSLALIVEDPDAPRGTFRHLGVFNIPPSWEGLPESADTKNGGGPRFAVNDFGFARYDGPQPPKGHGTHHYHFKLAALDVPNLSVPASAGIEAIWKEACKHKLDETELVGTFEAH
jgi:Raf kinase inhibitor-like YbhB/YbcL family protein